MRKHASDPGDPYNRCKSVFPVHELVASSPEIADAIAKSCLSGAIGCVECKNKLVAAIWELLGPFQEARAKLEDQDDYVVDVLRDGGKRARAMVSETVAIVREKMGITIYRPPTARPARRPNGSGW
jgi:tryptophanyl-tRNA synthetase